MVQMRQSRLTWVGDKLLLLWCCCDVGGWCVVPGWRGPAYYCNKSGLLSSQLGQNSEFFPKYVKAPYFQLCPPGQQPYNN